MGDFSALSQAYNDQTPPPFVATFEPGQHMTRDAGKTLLGYVSSLDDPNALFTTKHVFALAARAAERKQLRIKLGETLKDLNTALTKSDTLQYKDGYVFDIAVKDVQDILQRLGYKEIKLDGILGPKTARGILKETRIDLSDQNTLSLEGFPQLQSHLERANSHAYSAYQSEGAKDIQQQMRDARDTIRSIEQRTAQIVTTAIHACTGLKLMVGDNFVRDMVEAYDGTKDINTRFENVVGVLDKHCTGLLDGTSPDTLAKIIGTLDTQLKEPMAAMRGVFAAEEREKLLDSDPRIRDALKEYEMRRFNL